MSEVNDSSKSCSPDEITDKVSLKKREDHLSLCLKLGEIIFSSLELEEVLFQIMNASRSGVGASNGSILLVEKVITEAGKEEEQLIFKVAQGPLSSYIPKDLHMKKGQGIVGWVWINNKTLLIPDAYADPRFEPGVDKRTGYHTKTILCAPLCIHGRVIGVAQLINKNNGREFDDQDREIFEHICSLSALAIENARLHAELMRRQREIFELEIAADIQKNFIPGKAPSVPGLDIAGLSRPCSSTCGDYFDYLQLKEGEFGIAIGDVSGHGIGAALLMAGTRAYIRSTAQEDLALDQIINKANANLFLDVGMSGNFMTFCLLAIDSKANEQNGSWAIRWVLAGHTPPLLYDPDSDRFSNLEIGGPPLGIDPGYIYNINGPIFLAPGQVLILSTDGLLEAKNSEGILFGQDNQCRVVRENIFLSAKEILDKQIQAVNEYRGGEEGTDDLTLIVIKALDRTS